MPWSRCVRLGSAQTPGSKLGEIMRISEILAVCWASLLAQPFPHVCFRGLPQRDVAGRREQPRDARALPHHARGHAAHQHQLPHGWEDGPDPAGLPLPQGDPGHLQPLRPGQARQEAAGSSHDLWHSLWVKLGEFNVWVRQESTRWMVF